MSGPELHVVDGGPPDPVPGDPEWCLCGRRVEQVIRKRDGSIGLCKVCYLARISELKRGSGRGA